CVRGSGQWCARRSANRNHLFSFVYIMCILLFLDDHGNSNGSHVKIFLPKKLLECLPKCSSLPKERHRWNTNELRNSWKRQVSQMRVQHSGQGER
uniref:Calmodulin binding transcription activator 1 n=1 Tax=Anser cygnoides TaxID=8845 RepID=A0A8B9EC29_ANSCY